MDEWNPWPQAAVPQTVYVYHDDDAAGAAVIGAVIGFVIGAVFALLLLAARLLVWAAPLVVRLAIAGTRALHDAAAGRLIEEPAGLSRRQEAVRC